MSSADHKQYERSQQEHESQRPTQGNNPRTRVRVDRNKHTVRPSVGGYRLKGRVQHVARQNKDCSHERQAKCRGSHFDACIHKRLITHFDTHCHLTFRISELAPSKTDMQPRRNRALRCIRFVRPRVSHLENLSTRIPQTVPTTKTTTNPQRDTVPVR
jgi:hypothetical protein